MFYSVVFLILCKVKKKPLPNGKKKNLFPLENFTVKSSTPDFKIWKLI